MRIVKSSIACLLGLCIYAAVFQRDVAVAMMSKATGGDQPCPWSNLVAYPWNILNFVEIQKKTEKSVSVMAEDAELGIQQIHTAGRPFWVKKNGAEMNGQGTVAYVLAEQEWIADTDPRHTVKPGNVVVDVGAHIGTFDDDALKRGASKCILIEPDPVNVACIRRNFAKEIAAGKIVVVPEGAWSSHSTLEFTEGVANSGTGSFVLHEQGGKTFKVPVRPLDEMLKELGIMHVDFLKMDIEGAEREALKGAAETLRTSKPILMLDSYHRSDDAVVLPQVIHTANPAYQASCAACSPDRLGNSQRLIPYAVFYQ